jgi:TPR repeat protein
MASRALVVFFVVSLATAGCHRGGSSHGDQPAPSASVITLGVELGACTDVEACDRECRQGSADRCRRLAASYEFGRGVDKDEAKATTLYELGCAMKDPSSCVFAGQMHEYARGVPADPAKATALYTQACDQRWAGGCYNEAIMYENGRGVPVDRAKAADLYQLACAAGAKLACDKAADLRKPPPANEPAFLDGSMFR